MSTDDGSSRLRLLLRVLLMQLSQLVTEAPAVPVRIEETDGDIRLSIEVAPAGAPATEGPPVPSWDGRTLCWCGRPIHTFRMPAERQTALLDAFEAEGWPRRIVNPLRIGDQPDPKVMADAIAALNRSLPAGSVRFRQDAGDALWEPS